MQQTTIDKFTKWCHSIGASEDKNLINNENDFPTYSIHDNELFFNGEYDDGYFILKLLDYSSKPKTNADNGIVIRKLVWNDNYNYYAWYETKNRADIYKVLVYSDLSKNGIKNIQKWISAHTNYPKFPTFTVSDFSNLIKDFIYKIDDSKQLKVESSYSSIDEFFNNDFVSGDSLAIKAVDADLTLITIEKVIIDDDEAFRFIVNINTDRDDEFKIKTTFDTQEKFKSLVTATVNALKEYKEFYKYADDLENCL